MSFKAEERERNWGQSPSQTPFLEGGSGKQSEGDQVVAASLEMKPEDAVLNFSHTTALESELRQLEICWGHNLQLRCRGQLLSLTECPPTAREIMDRAPLQLSWARLSAQVLCLFRVNQEGFRLKGLCIHYWPHYQETSLAVGFRATVLSLCSYIFCCSRFFLFPR